MPRATIAEPVRAELSWAWRSRCARALLSLCFSLLSTFPARAEPAPSRALQAAAPSSEFRVPSSAEQRSLALQLAPDGLWFAVCGEGTCSARAGRHLELPADVAQATGKGTLEALDLATGRRAVHVRVPLADGAWEALLAAGVRSSDALVIYAGKTGATAGEDGQRQGDALWVREGDNKGQRVLVGKVREDVQLCGRPTILEPRLLDRDLRLRAALVQQLGLEERRSAPVLRAHRVAGPTPGGNALRAWAASSAVGEPQFLTDGRSDTSWSEGRGGDGRGEFVLLRPLSGAALVAVEFLVHGDAGTPPADAGAPHVLWLATRSGLFRVDFDADAWRTPGVWYRAEFPSPVNQDCLALVLESSYPEHAERRVTLAEVRGISELQALSPAELVARLSTPGDAGAAAVPALLQAGEPGVAAVVGAFGALDALGRGRALDVLDAGNCEQVADAYARVLEEDDPYQRRRAEQRLRSCGPSALGALRTHFQTSTGESAVRLADALAEIAPELAVELLGARLASAAGEHAADFRAALHRAAEHTEAAPALRHLLAEGAASARFDLELLRALADQLPRFEPEARQSFARAARASDFDSRFLLIEAAVWLAPSAPEARAFLVHALDDPDPYLRGAVARAAPNVPELRPALLRATRDSEVRVREASVLRLGEIGLATAVPDLRERLQRDAWPLVRVAAAQALSGYRDVPELDGVLAGALSDPAPPVRAASVRALGRRGASARVPLILERFNDPAEAAVVRAASAQALGELCAASALEPLAAALQRMLGERPAVDDLLVGTAAISALGRLRPPDLEQRLAPLLGKESSPVLRHLAMVALSARPHCASGKVVVPSSATSERERR